MPVAHVNSLVVCVSGSYPSTILADIMGVLEWIILVVIRAGHQVVLLSFALSLSAITRLGMS